MRHFKHYCKLIFSTLVVVLVFACNSIVSHADPLTGAMLAAGAADGFIAAGFGSASASSISAIFSNVSYTDIIPWSDLVIAGKAYLTIRDLIGSNNVEIEVPSDISNAGYYRLEQLNRAYGLSPGTLHTIGSYPAYNDYVFNRSFSGGLYNGPIFATVPKVDFSVAFDQTYYLDPSVSIRFYKPANSSRITFAPSIFGVSTSEGTLQSDTSRPVSFRFRSSTGSFIFAMQPSASNTYGSTWVTPASSPVTTITPLLSRSADSEIVVPNGKVNKVVVPASSVSGITYTSGEPVTTEADVVSILDRIAEAFTNQEIVSSEYDASPVPTPTGDTISETAYSVLNDTFDEFKEFFGDIYDGITGFHESFGDWVDDVASGWTEVFGDIYSDLHGFKESFGDWVDDVASGWTEVFGDIYSTLSGTIADTLSTISSGIQSIVQSIENADFGFVDAFWKNFLAPFNSLFNTIKSHLSIWHYVVEWLASISSVFTFYLGVFSGAGSTFLLPIYACFAGTVVIAVYRRFGK